jgi:hypothetical protein
MAFTISNKYFYSIILFLLFLIVVYIGNSFKRNYLETNDEYKLIQTYLLNDSPLYGFDKPKLWIHTKYEINSRQWKSFQSRSSTDLNQPFIHLTIKTIVSHCAKDFNICLIDDETFEKLLPNWDVNLAQVAEPNRSRIRQLGLLKLVYYYGGLVVPNSFICSRNLKGLYEEGTMENKPFVCENINRTANLVMDKRHRAFLPDLYFFGAKKNNETLKEIIEFVKAENREPHFSAEVEFLGDFSFMVLSMCQEQKINLIDGSKVGVKTIGQKSIGVEELMGDGFLDLEPNYYGIYIPDEEILGRTYYSWFAVLSKDELMLNTNITAMKYIIASLVDTTDEYKETKEKREIRSVVAI